VMAYLGQNSMLDSSKFAVPAPFLTAQEDDPNLNEGLTINADARSVTTYRTIIFNNSVVVIH